MSTDLIAFTVWLAGIAIAVNAFFGPVPAVAAALGYAALFGSNLRTGRP